MVRENAESLRGNLDLMVLSTLAGGPKYGYLIAQRLADASGGMIAIPAGTLYPILHKLEDDRLIKSRWDETTGRQRKWYELTAKGSKQLVRRATQWRQVTQCLQDLLAPVLKSLPDPA